MTANINARRFVGTNRRSSSSLMRGNPRNMKSNRDNETTNSSFSLEDTLKLKLNESENENKNEYSSSKKQKQQQRRFVFIQSKWWFYGLFLVIIVMIVRQGTMLVLYTLTGTTTTTATATATTASTITAAAAAAAHDNEMIRTVTKRNQMEPKPGEYAPVINDGAANSDAQQQQIETLSTPPTNTYHIFVLGKTLQLSTIRLINIVIGLFDSSDAFLATTTWSVVGNQYLTRYKNEWVESNTTIVSLVPLPPDSDDEAPQEEVTQLLRDFRQHYQHMFFIIARTKSTTKSNSNTKQELVICDAPDIICVDPYMVANTNEINNGATMTVTAFISTIQQHWNYFSKIKFDLVEALRRLNGMEEMILQMGDMPSTTSDIKYGVYGASKG